MSNIKHIDEIISLLLKKLNKKRNPILSRSKWKNINRTPFTTLISCILSLRTKDEVTEKASIRLLNKYDTQQKIIKISENKIRELIYPVGFYKTKSKRIK